MKKYILFFLLPIFLAGCEKNYDTVIDSNNVSYQVLETSSFNSFTFSPSDSSITVTLKVNSSSEIKNIYVNIFSSDEKQLNNSPVELLDNGSSANGDATASDNIFSNKFPLSQFYPVGLYSIRFYVTDISNSTQQVAEQNFSYDNGQSNKAPVLSNITAPDTVTVTSTSVIFMSVKAFDENGLSDIEKVYFTVTRPNGTSSGIKTDMFDDGDVNAHGDIEPNDGIYSVLVQVTSDNAKGTYRFDYQALDRGGKLSETISHNIEIK